MAAPRSLDERGHGTDDRLRHLAGHGRLPAGALLVAPQWVPVAVETAEAGVAETGESDRAAEVPARAAVRRGLMADPAARDLYLRGPAMRTAPSRHGLMVAAPLEPVTPVSGRAQPDCCGRWRRRPPTKTAATDALVSGATGHLTPVWWRRRIGGSHRSPSRPCVCYVGREWVVSDLRRCAVIARRPVADWWSVMAQAVAAEGGPAGASLGTPFGYDSPNAWMRADRPAELATTHPMPE